MYKLDLEKEEEPHQTDNTHQIIQKAREFQTILRNLYAVQETTVRTLYGTTDWFRIEKGVRQVCL